MANSEAKRGVTVSRRLVVGIAAALAAPLLLGACALAPSGAPSQPPVTALITDVSGSTRHLRAPGGLFERAWAQAAAATAAREGTLWAGTADGNTVADNEWLVAGKTFATDLPSDGPLGPAALRHQARRLGPTNRRVMRWKGAAGSDLLGALRNAGRLFRNYPDRPRALVLLTDGGVNVGGVNVYGEPPKNFAAANRIVRRLRRSHQLTNLSGTGPTVRVWIGGLANGVHTPAQASGIVRFWHALIKACNAELVAQDGGALPLVGFSE